MCYTEYNAFCLFCSLSLVLHYKTNTLIFSFDPQSYLILKNKIKHYLFYYFSTESNPLILFVLPVNSQHHAQRPFDRLFPPSLLTLSLTPIVLLVNRGLNAPFPPLSTVLPPRGPPPFLPPGHRLHPLLFPPSRISPTFAPAPAHHSPHFSRVSLPYPISLQHFHSATARLRHSPLLLHTNTHPLAMAQPGADNNLRIHVNADGVVEFSVSLTDAVDPSMVASMVAAVRRGIVDSPAQPAHPAQSAQSPHPRTTPIASPALEPPTNLTTSNPPSQPDSIPAQLLPPSTSQTLHQPHTSSSQPLAHPSHTVPSADRNPSPLVAFSSRSPSVRQLAAEFDGGGPQSRQSPRLPDPSLYEPSREFSSTPAVWSGFNLQDGPPALTRLPSSSALAVPSSSSMQLRKGHSSASERSEYDALRAVQSSLSAQDRPDEDENNAGHPPSRDLHPSCSLPRPEKASSTPHISFTTPVRSVTADHPIEDGMSPRPIRIQSLPPGARPDTVEGMYFGSGEDPSLFNSQGSKTPIGEFEPHLPLPLAHAASVPTQFPSTSLPMLHFPQHPTTPRMSRVTPPDSLPRTRSMQDEGVQDALPTGHLTHDGKHAAVTSAMPPSSISVQPLPDSAAEDDSGQPLSAPPRMSNVAGAPESTPMPTRQHSPPTPYLNNAPSNPNLDPALENEDTWEHVEYVLTESYRQAEASANLDEPGTGADIHAPTNMRANRWRLFSNIGSKMSRRRPEVVEDIHQSTLAEGAPAYAAADREKDSPGHNGAGGMHAGGVAAGNKPLGRRLVPLLFNRNNVRNGSLWFEFSSSLGAERMVAEVGKIAKTLGYQVWRRPGENKLRCIRRLTHRHEMHMVILVGTIGLPDGQMTVVRLRRARGDRNRTENWRYAQFYRELIERLQRYGIEILGTE